MLKILKSEDRGHANHGWLDSYHSFSFADYHNPAWMGFQSLRVINQDHISPSQGFGTHPHRDMEIITYVLKGELAHKDSMGNGSVIKPGDVQRMTAGTGVRHSEYNHSESEAVDLLQIWILPEKTGLEPSYEQKFFSPEAKHNQMCLVASQDGKDNSVLIHQDARIYASVLDQDQTLNHQLSSAHAWLQVIKGDLNLNNQELHAGDGVGISQTSELNIQALNSAEFLLFELN